MDDRIIGKINEWTTGGILPRTAGVALVRWLTEAEFTAYREDIIALVEAGVTDELEDTFGSQIAFGTGGIRGRMGPGPNRFNTHTVGLASQGLAQYIAGSISDGAADRSEGEPGVVVAWDTRHNSEAYARETARVLAANAIPVLIFDGCRSTSALSFAVRDLHASAGVMISASHNPPGDNGFKVYGPDGGQVVAPRDEAITREMGRVAEIRRIDYDAAVTGGLIRTIGKDQNDRYLDVLSDMTLADARDIRVVYTPLHGAGMTSVGAALEKMGFKDVHYVDEQTVLDADFSTLEQGIANPEKPGAFRLGIQKAEEIGADLVLASDPDADRIGCALPLPDRGWVPPPEELVLNGHQIGALLCHYVLVRRHAAGTLPGRGLFCQTAVTSDLAAIIARSFGMEVIDDLPVGFKQVGAAIQNMSPDMTFVFGTEESHGYLADARIRDKEAATGILLAEYAALLKSDRRTLRDALDDIYREYGYFKDVHDSVALPGADGTRRISGIMAALRASPPGELGGRTVCRMIDRQSGSDHDLLTGTTAQVDGIRVNILVFTLSEAGHTRVIARPSGTEPTIKYYVSVSTVDMDRGWDSEDGSKDSMEGSRDFIDGLAESILADMIAYCEQIEG